MWKLEIEDSFSAAHALRHYQGKCEKVHGHNFSVKVTVQGNQLHGDTQILVDFKILKNLLKHTLEQVDHCILNEKPPFDSLNPSSENLAVFIWNELEFQLKNCPEAVNTALYSVSISEKPGQTAIYMKTGSD